MLGSHASISLLHARPAVGYVCLLVQVLALGTLVYRQDFGSPNRFPDSRLTGPQRLSVQRWTYALILLTWIVIVLAECGRG